MTEPRQIAEVLARHDEVQQATVVVLRDLETPRLVAYAVSKSGTAPSVGSLRAWVDAALPAGTIPVAFVLVDAFEVLADGTVDHARLPVPSAFRPDVETPYVAPRTPVEGTLAEICARVLKLDQVGIDDDFLELGGDSLAAIQLVVEIETTFGIEVPVWAVFERPTVAAMASHVQGQPATAASDPCADVL